MKPPASRKTRFLQGLVVASVVVVAVLLAIGRFAGSHHYLADIPNHFHLQAFFWCAGCLFFLLLLRRSLHVLIPLPVMLVLVPGIFFPPRPVPLATSAPTLRFVSFNVFTPNRRHEETIHWIHRTLPDAIYLTETDSVWIRELSALHEDYPHHVEFPMEDNFGFAFYSRYPIRQHRIVHLGRLSLPLLVAELETPGQPVTVIGAHPVPPVTSFWAEERDSFIAATAGICREISTPLVVMGDWNATRWSHPMKNLRDVPLYESHRFPAPTWNRRNPVSAIAIDHLFVRGSRSAPAEVAIIRSEIGPDLGSDHRPVMADLHWPAPSAQGR